MRAGRQARNEDAAAAQTIGGRVADEIADEAGISKPMVYAYLGSKDDLFDAVLARTSSGSST